MKKSGTGLFRNQLFIPLAALLLLMIFNLIAESHRGSLLFQDLTGL